jgi:hypothetical protein
VKRYANELHPGNIDKKGKTKTVKSPNSNSNTSHSSSNSLEHLYALQEEQTPISSPERDLCHHENDYCLFRRQDFSGFLSKFGKKLPLPDDPDSLDN